MGSGGWSQHRPALLAAGGFGLGLVVLLAAAAGGPAAALLAVAVLALAGRALHPRLRRSLAAEAQRRQRLQASADQQHQWAARGDPRGVYGPEGAALMRAVAPPQPIVPPGPALEVATVVETPAELVELLAKKLPCWRYAAFVSVLMQRRDAVRHRLLDARTGFAAAPTESLGSDSEAGIFVTERLAEMCGLTEQLESFMLSPAFQVVFGDRETSADADGIVHAAHRLMDYHDRLLDLNERCREVAVPQSCAALLRDMIGLTLAPVDGFRRFIDSFAERVGETADVARYASGDVDLDPVTLSIDSDDALIERISERLVQIARTTSS